MRHTGRNGNTQAGYLATVLSAGVFFAAPIMAGIDWLGVNW